MHFYVATRFRFLEDKVTDKVKMNKKQWALSLTPIFSTLPCLCVLAHPVGLIILELLSEPETISNNAFSGKIFRNGRKGLFFPI